ncbi:hypothetical protein FS837_005708 [Tulasnella sp. UAMH 9824]|nr:hypothetical protein FS837_005708 [Tulasnella sp. UAMH 9824]
MDVLPPELLSQIFSLLLPIPRCDLKPEAFERIRAANRTSLRLVSKDWNQVILDTAELWAYIEINSLTASIEQYLSRSGNSLLHVRITVDDEATALPSVQKALEMAFSCTERWKSYSLWDVRNFDEGSSNSISFINLIPSQPFPALQIASLVMSPELNSEIVLNAPALNRLDTWLKPNLHLTDSPFLTHWSMSSVPDWTGMIRNLTACPKLEKLSIMEKLGRTIPETIPTSITMPVLKELELYDSPACHQFLARLEAPRLRTFIFSRYRSPVPFALHRSTSSLVIVRFTNNPRLNPIRRAVAAQPLLQQLTVEIDACSSFLRKHAPRTDFEQLKSDRSWLERHTRIKWIGEEPDPSYWFQTWEEAHGLVPL